MERGTGAGVGPATGEAVPQTSGDSMKRLMTIFAAAGAAFALSACEPPSDHDGRDEVSDIPTEPPVADAAADSAADAAATAPTDDAPVDHSTLPADRRSSEESVQPESETLFF